MQNENWYLGTLCKDFSMVTTFLETNQTHNNVCFDHYAHRHAVDNSYKTRLPYIHIDNNLNVSNNNHDCLFTRHN